MNVDVLQGKWDQLQGEVKEQWGKLTDDDLSRVKGKREQLEGALQEKYGYTKKKAREEVDSFLEEMGHQFDDVRSTLQDTVEDAQGKLKKGKKKAGKMAKQKADEYNQKLEEAVSNVPGNPVQLVNEYPWLVVAAVLLVGVVVGLLLRPSRN